MYSTMYLHFQFVIFFRLTGLWCLLGAVVTAEISPVVRWSVNFVQRQYKFILFKFIKLHPLHLRGRVGGSMAPAVLYHEVKPVDQVPPPAIFHPSGPPLRLSLCRVLAPHYHFITRGYSTPPCPKTLVLRYHGPWRTARRSSPLSSAPGILLTGQYSSGRLYSSTTPRLMHRGTFSAECWLKKKMQLYF